MSQQYFQGDLMFVKSDNVYEQMTKPTGKIVLARGEKTGHSHVIDTTTSDIIGYRLWENSQVVVVGENGATVVHESDRGDKNLHEPLELERGVYEVYQQRRWTPEKVKRVVD